MLSHISITKHRRLWLGALLFGLIGCLAAGGICAAGFMANQQNTQREVAARNLRQLLKQARAFSITYVRERLEERQVLQQRLNREATDVCSDIQIFLQTALVRQEAQRNARRNTALQKGGEELQQMLRQQAENAAKMAAALTSASAAITSITPLASDGSSSALGSASGSDGAITVTPSPISDEEKNVLLQEFAQLQEKTIRKIASLDAAAVAKKEDDQTVRLLRESGADIEGFLPKYGSFTVAEAGGRVLLTLGAGNTTASKSSLRAEATRNLLLASDGSSVHWVVRVVLNDLSAPALPDGKELAQYLGERLGLQVPVDTLPEEQVAPTLTGVVYNSDGSMAGTFPLGAENEFVQTSLASGWQNDQFQQQFFERVDALAPAEWGIGLLVTLPVLPVKAQLTALAGENPAAVIGFIVAALLLLVGIIINARLAWRGIESDGTRVDAAMLSALTQNAGLVSPRPILGSLERLQVANRGRLGEGSRILDLAKSPVLRDLASRVRRVSNSPDKEGRPGLREYGKGRGA